MLIDGNTGAELPSCATCRWWDTLNSLGHSGICRRMPPNGGHWRPTREAEQNWIGANWPETINDDWCGEHQAQLVDLTR